MALPTPALHTARLRLRPFNARDAGALFALQSDASVLRYWDAPPWSERARADRFIAACRQIEDEGSGARLAIDRISDDVFVGWCGLTRWNPDSREGTLREDCVVNGEVTRRMAANGAIGPLRLPRSLPFGAWAMVLLIFGLVPQAGGAFVSYPGSGARRRGRGARLCGEREGPRSRLRRPGAPLTVSGWRDLNPRPLRPERSALPSCATPRSMLRIAAGQARPQLPLGRGLSRRG